MQQARASAKKMVPYEQYVRPYPRPKYRQSKQSPRGEKPSSPVNSIPLIMGRLKQTADIANMPIPMQYRPSIQS